MIKIRFLSIILLTGLLVGCDSMSKLVFNKKLSPDEFSVFTRAPLSIPRDFGLKAPKPGTPRPQNVSSRDRAEQAVLGRKANRNQKIASTNRLEGSRGVILLLRDTGGLKAPETIRETLNNEADGQTLAQGSITDKLLFWESKELLDVVVHPLREAHRIKKAKTRGKKVTGQGSVIISRFDDPNRSALDKFFFD